MVLKSQIKIATIYSILFILGTIAEAFTVKENLSLTYTKLYESDEALDLLFTMGIVHFISNLGFFHFLFCLKIESLILSQIGFFVYFLIQSYLASRTGLTIAYIFVLLIFITNIFVIGYFFNQILSEIEWLYYREVGADPLLQKSYIIIRLGVLCRSVGYIVYAGFFFAHLIHFTKTFLFDLLIYIDIFVLPAEYVLYTKRYEKRKYGMASILLLGIVFFIIIIEKLGYVGIANVNQTEKKPISLSTLQLAFIFGSFILAVLEYRNFDIVHYNLYTERKDLILDE